MAHEHTKRGFFYEAFQAPPGVWECFTVPGTENPRIRPERLEREREAMGAACFAQEFLREFVDNGSTVFDMPWWIRPSMSVWRR